MFNDSATPRLLTEEMALHAIGTQGAEQQTTAKMLFYSLDNMPSILLRGKADVVKTDVQWIPDEDRKEARKTLFGGNVEEEFGANDGAVVRRRDLHSLRQDVWLNDEVINFTLEDLFKNFERSQCMLTFFYNRFCQFGYDTVRRYTKKINVFKDSDFFCVPLHQGQHWALGVVNFKRKCLQYVDSLYGVGVDASPRTYDGIDNLNGHQHEAAYLLNLAKWVEHEYKNGIQVSKQRSELKLKRSKERADEEDAEDAEDAEETADDTEDTEDFEQARINAKMCLLFEPGAAHMSKTEWLDCTSSNKEGTIDTIS